MTNPPSRPQPSTEDPATGPPAIQTAIEQTRARLLDGHGPGATRQEIDQHTRARTHLGGQPTAQRLQALAHQTALARGESGGPR
ncbi:MAG: hypothetical protein M3Y48_11355 [Actinomycetota bacterium]|nr:hypothetical protein [Actinomycetota bacterium]